MISPVIFTHYSYFSFLACIHCSLAVRIEKRTVQRSPVVLLLLLLVRLF